MLKLFLGLGLMVALALGPATAWACEGASTCACPHGAKKDKTVKGPTKKAASATAGEVTACKCAGDQKSCACKKGECKDATCAHDRVGYFLQPLPRIHVARDASAGLRT